MHNRLRTLIILAVMATVTATAFAGKPLKVFILAGQSNMQGKARVYTIERLKLTEDSLQMYKDMGVKDGVPSAVKDVYGVYGKQHGPLRPGFKLGPINKKTMFGPEYTFSLYMKKHLNEPFLIIKTAWGGKNLLQQFRSPSAGRYKKEKDRHGKPTGYYYNLMIKEVKEALADPGKFHPSFNKVDGYEIAGFVWFQGYNDAIADYPQKSEVKDYSEYSRLLTCFIRDVRNDLKVPQMPFVIGVMGIDGDDLSTIKRKSTRQNKAAFRKAQAEPAALPEFKGNVAAVETGPYWDMELDRIHKKLYEATEKAIFKTNPNHSRRGLRRKIERMMNSEAPNALTPEELKIRKVGQSNAAFHYMGSAYIYGGIGKAFADAMAKMMK